MFNLSGDLLDFILAMALIWVVLIAFVIGAFYIDNLITKNK